MTRKNRCGGEKRFSCVRDNSNRTGNAQLCAFHARPVWQGLSGRPCLVSRRKWSLPCVSSTMVSTRMWIFRLADNHRDSDASILVFKSVAATVYAFSYSTRTPPTSGDDGVRQPSLQISLKRRGRKHLEQFLLVFRYFSRKNWTSAVTAQKRRGYFPITWLHLQLSRTLFLCVIFSVSKTRLPTPHFIDYGLLLVHITGHFTASLTNNFWFSTYVITFFHH